MRARRTLNRSPRRSAALVLVVLGALLAAGLTGAPAVHRVSPATPRPMAAGGTEGSSQAAGPAGTPAHFPVSLVDDNWPTFLGDAQRTGMNWNERTLAASNASHLKERWDFSVNGSMSSSPSYVNGTVYFGAWNGYEYAVNASTGHLVWKSFLGTTAYCYVGGIDSSPTIWNGTLYTGTGTDYWDALNLATGKVEWKVYVGDDSNGNFNWASPLLYENYLYIGVASCSDSPLVWGRLLQVNLTGVHSVFHTFDVVPNSQIGGSIWATPAVDPAANLVWVATGNDDGSDVQPLSQSIVALNATTLARVGSWQVPNVNGYDDDFGSTETLVDTPGGHIILDMNKDGTVYAFNRSNVSSSSWGPSWERTLGGIYAPACFDGTDVIIPGGYGQIGPITYDQTVWGLNPLTGATVWEQGTNNGTIYAGEACANGVAVDGAGGVVEVRNATNGKMLYGFTMPNASIQGSPSIAAGQIFVGDGDQFSLGDVVDLGLPFAGNAAAMGPPADAPSNVSFSAGATGGLPPYTFAWNFGDGSNGTGARPTHAYSTGGTYQVWANGTDGAGEGFTDRFNVTVLPALSAVLAPLTFTEGVAPFTAQFQALVSGGDGGPYSYLWNRTGGLAFPSASITSFSFATAGLYTVTLAVNDSTGGRAVVTANVTVVDPLVVHASVGPSTGETPLNVSFHLTTSAGAPPLEATWDFGDGTPTVTGLAPSHVFTIAGSFEVSAIVTDAVHEVRAAYLNLSVAAPPIVAIDPTLLGPNCGNSTVGYSFIAAVTGGAAPFNLTWNFGDGTRGTGAVLYHHFSGSGARIVSVTVRDALNGTNLSTTTVEVPSLSCPPPPPNGGGGGGGGGGSGTSASPAFLDSYGWVLEVTAGAILVGAVVVVFLRTRPPPRTRLEPERE